MAEVKDLLDYRTREDLNTLSDQPLVSSFSQSAKPPYLKLQKKQSQGQFLLYLIRANIVVGTFCLVPKKRYQDKTMMTCGQKSIMTQIVYFIKSRGVIIAKIQVRQSKWMAIISPPPPLVEIELTNQFFTETILF